MYHNIIHGGSLYDDQKNKKTKYNNSVDLFDDFAFMLSVYKADLIFKHLYHSKTIRITLHQLPDYVRYLRDPKNSSLDSFIKYYPIPVLYRCTHDPIINEQNRLKAIRKKLNIDIQNANNLLATIYKRRRKKWIHAYTAVSTLHSYFNNDVLQVMISYLLP
jgi:hypothetical protein